MDVKVVFVIACLWALAITSTEAGITNCCTRVRLRVKQETLKKVQRYEVQEINDRCEIQALVLFVKGMEKPLCAHPRMKAVVEKLKKKKSRSSF